MSHSTYDDALTIAKKAMHQTLHLLNVAEKYVADNHLDESKFLDLQLYPDMFPFVKQVQVASDNAKGLASRISGMENPVMKDTEKSFSELKTRIENTLQFVNSAKPMDSDKIDALEVSFFWMEGKALSGHDCVISYNIPNLFFHVSMAYAIMRSNGIPIGKADYIGELPFYELA